MTVALREGGRAPVLALAHEAHDLGAARPVLDARDGGRAGDLDAHDLELELVGVVDGLLDLRDAVLPAGRQAVDERLGEDAAADLRGVLLRAGRREVLDDLGDPAPLAREAVAGGLLRGAAARGGDREDGEEGGGSGARHASRRVEGRG
ncbi:MAG: hypothetical protein AVDCRST_MAG30-3479 [uncultured Solirubrobacteraceae bacterium]|uniref:Uncharacterized protein n=1 Tax=uncultured Solirubrobacteraceae bacterium TaxID=1162706 RepID=A0A6J4TMD0_9ACTN|nr:MAG: hypothetical protein AVDCRST_MAG30-3479 [uncultured Solirubrobacteraceae bacterium]